MVSTRYFCQKCGKELEAKQKPCAFCGFYPVFITDKGKGDDCVKVIRQIKIEDKGMARKETLKIRQKLKGFRKFVKESIDGWVPSGDKKKHPEGIEKIRVVDREHPDAPDSYQEIITDVKTGKIIRNVKELLSQHRSNKYEKIVKGTN